MSVLQILTNHQLGFMGVCVDDKGFGDCGWTAKRPIERHGSYDAQHRAHVAELIEAPTLFGGAA